MELFNMFLDVPNLKYVLFGVLLIAIASAIVGTFTFLSKRSLVSDTISHSVLPGITIAFLVVGEKDIVALIIGAFLAGWLSIISINAIVNHTKLSEDTAIALVLSVFFGFGILLLVSIQHSDNGQQSGLDHFIFGKAAALVGRDLKIFATICLIVITTVSLTFKELKIIIFDKTFAQSIGLPIRKLEITFEILIILTIISGIQAIGIILTAAMLITPVAIGMFWTQKLNRLLLLSILFNCIAGLTGVYISYFIPRMPTGPWIVIALSVLLLFSFLFGKYNGLLGRFIVQQRNRLTVLQENILKTFYKCGEGDGAYQQFRTKHELLKVRFFENIKLNWGLFLLKNKNFLTYRDQHWSLTDLGLEKAARIVKLHRLWELYLTEHVDILDDHVHYNAEVMEHLITPEIETELEQKMNFPTHDPHNRKIPYLEV